MIGPYELVSAFILDLIIGDPRWLPHPVRIIGRAITFFEEKLRAIFGKNGEEAAGFILVLLIVLPAGIIALLIRDLLRIPKDGVLSIASTAIMIYLTATTIALRELISSSRLVVKAIGNGDIGTARKNLSMIVGRDTERLSEDGVLRATIETLAENLSDGVIAPLFYLAIGGFPLAVAYKAINTLDSMVGYKNEKYILFGRPAAKLDDAANYIPARITGLLIVLASFCFSLVHRPGIACSVARRSFEIMKRDGRNHTSPNSGMPEAAMAGCLDVRLGGPSTYGGVLVQKPFIGDEGVEDYRSGVEKAFAIVVLASMIAVISAGLLLRVMSFLF